MITLDEGAALVGAHCWTERRLFETLGAWVGSTPDLDAKLTLDRHSQHHAWRAGQWWDRLPVLASVERADLVRPPSPKWALLVDALGSLDSPVARLAGAYRVALPRLSSAYRAHRDELSSVSDGAVIRTLAQVSADLVSDWVEGEAILEGLVRSAAAVDAAAAAVARLERLLSDDELSRP
jgi:hypothetical protein